MLFRCTLTSFEAKHVLFRFGALVIAWLGRLREQFLAIATHGDVHSAGWPSVCPQSSGFVLHAAIYHRTVDVGGDLIHLLTRA